MSSDVGVTIRVVPDGFEDPYYRVSLVLMPDATSSDGTRVDFANWPAKIAELARNISVQMATPFIGSGAVQAPPIGNENLEVSFNRIPGDANALWQTQFNDVFDAQKLADAQKTTRIENIAPLTDAREVRVISYSPKYLAMAVETLHGAAAIRSMGRTIGRAAQPYFGPALAHSEVDLAVHQAMFGLHFPGSRSAYLGSLVQTEPTVRTGARSMPVPGVLLSIATRGDPAGQIKVPLLPNFTARLEEAYWSARDTAKNIAGGYQQFLDDPNGTRPVPSKPFSWKRSDSLPLPNTEELQAVKDALKALTSYLLEPNPDMQTTRQQTIFQTDLVPLHRQFALHQAALRPERPLRAASPLKSYEIMLRRLAAIMAYPTLAKFFNLIIDVKINKNVFEQTVEAFEIGTGAVRYGLLSASLGGDSAGAIWSAYKRRPAASFGPCSAEEYADALEQPHAEPQADLYASCDGLLNLGVELAGSGRRFELVTIDHNTAVEGAQNASNSIVTQLASGDSADRVNPDLSGMKTIGIALVDGLRNAALVTDVIRAFDLHSSKTGSQAKDLMLFSDDLTVGYRLDVAIQLKSGAFRWFSLNERVVGYDNAIQRFIGGLDADPRRDNGYIRTISRVTSAPENPPDRNGKDQSTVQNEAIVNQTFAVWRGLSLAVPGCGSSTAEVNADQDLNLDFTYDLPSSDPSRLLPPLRFGRKYRFGVRLVYLNGGGLGLADARRLYADPRYADFVLPPDEPLNFRRHEPIGAPSLHLKDSLLPEEEHLGEQLDVLVVQNGDDPHDRLRNVSHRVAVLPRISDEDFLETHGVFDDKTSARPDGAYSNAVLCKETGDFPVLKSNGELWCPLPAGPVDETKQSVFRAATDPKRPNVPHYPDPLATRISLAFVRGDLLAPNYPYPQSVPLYPPGRQWPDPLPLVIELGAPDASFGALKGARVVFRQRYLRTDGEISDTSGAVRVQWLRIELEKAEEIELVLWCPPEPDAVRGILAGTRSILDASQRIPTSKIATQLFGAAPNLDGVAGQVSATLEQMPLPMLTASRRLRLIHAVQRPLEPPTFSEASIPANQGFRAISVRTDSQKPDQTGWEQYVEGQPNSDPATWPDQPGAHIVFFVGTLGIEPRSTGRLECIGTWEEQVGDPKHFTVDDEGYIAFKERSERMFAVEPIDRNGPAQINLLREQGKPLRGLSYVFADGRARRITFRLQAVSRFTGYFKKPAPPASQAQDTVNPAQDMFNTPSKTTLTVWIRATQRPTAPSVDSILPAFISARTEIGHGVEVSRFVRLRIYLRDFLDKGEGQLLGLVCWPPELFGQAPEAMRQAVNSARLLSLGKLDERPVLAAYITRWGTDPTKLSGSLDALIPAGGFRNATTTASGLLMPMPAPDPALGASRPTIRGDDQPPSDPTTFVPVAVAGFGPPRYDVAQKLWFFDVHIEQSADADSGGAEVKAAYFPFLQIGLVHYQPHAITGYELSTPVASWIQLPPKRTARIIFVGARTIRVVVTGVGYSATATGMTSAGDQANRPVLDIRVLEAPDHRLFGGDHELKGALGPVAVGPNGAKLEFLNLTPEMLGAKVTWTSPDIELPWPWEWRAYVVFVEEYELISGLAESTPGLQLMRRGPTYIGKVDVRR